MSDLSSAAKANLEAARQSDGKFGNQPHSNPGQLSGLTGDEQKEFTYSDRNGVAGYVTEALGADADGYDIEAIVDDMVAAGMARFDEDKQAFVVADDPAFWEIAQRHDMDYDDPGSTESPAQQAFAAEFADVDVRGVETRESPTGGEVTVIETSDGAIVSERGEDGCMAWMPDGERVEGSKVARMCDRMNAHAIVEGDAAPLAARSVNLTTPELDGVGGYDRPGVIARCMVAKRRAAVDARMAAVEAATRHDSTGYKVAEEFANDATRDYAEQYAAIVTAPDLGEHSEYLQRIHREVGRTHSRVESDVDHHAFAAFTVAMGANREDANLPPYSPRQRSMPQI